MATNKHSLGLDEHTALIVIAALMGLNGVFLWFAWLLLPLSCSPIDMACERLNSAP